MPKPKKSNSERIYAKLVKAEWITDGIDEIAIERSEQLGAHGHRRESDRRYTHGELIKAAQAYLDYANRQAKGWPVHGTASAHIWPWAPQTFKPSAEIIKNLRKAGALIAAEIDRQKALEANEKENRQEKNRSRKN